eukprot:4647841-Pleurochrysis_carterae.AAC.1
MQARLLMCTHVFAEFARVYLHRVTRSCAARARMFAPIVNAHQCHLQSTCAPNSCKNGHYGCMEFSYVHKCTTHARVRRVREASASTQSMAQARTPTCTHLQCAGVHVSLHASVAVLHWGCSACTLLHNQSQYP